MSSALSHSGSSSPDSVESWKRKYDLLEAQCASAKDLGPKATTVTANQKRLGRGFRRLVDMFTSVRDLVEENDRRIEALADGTDDESNSDELNEERDALMRSYKELTKRIPLVRTLAEQGDVDVLEVLYKNLRIGSDAARGDDASNLKAAVITWINDLYGPSDPVLKAKSKDERGFANDHTGRLLCPGEFDWDDASVRSNIRDGHIHYSVTAQSWPTFCYADLVCDTNDIEKGLWKSTLLIKAFKSIFTSPSSAAEEIPEDAEGQPSAKRAKKSSTSTRSNVAVLIGLTSVTPRSIAYTAVQLRFALSSMNTWRTMDIDFDHMEFYRAIVDYFEVTPGPIGKAHVDDLIAWWNRKVFGRVTGTAKAPSHRESSSVSKLRAQRKLREEMTGPST